MARRQQKRRTGAAPPPPPKQPPPPPIHGQRLEHALHRLVRTRPVVVLGVIVAVHVLLALLTFLPQPHTGGDNAAYITLGRSLIQHGTYTELWDPAEPPHTKYPPVFPGMLAVAMLVGLEPWVQLKFIVLACSTLAVACTFLWLRARRRPLLALGIASIIAVAPGVLNEGHWLLSDVPFWAFTMLALWAFERLRPDDWKRFAIAAAATLLAYFTRTAGLPLVLAAFAWLAWHRHGRQLGALAAIIGVPALLWWLRGRAFAPAGYVSEFWLINPYDPALGRIGAADLFVRVAINAQKYLALHMPMLLTGDRHVLLALLCTVIFLLALIGWAKRLRRARVAELFVPLYLGLIFVWPDVWSGERFLLPVLPALLFYAGEASIRLLRRFAVRQSFVLPAAATALLLVAALPGLARALSFSSECRAEFRAGERYPCLGSNWTEYFAIAETMSEMVPDSAVVMTRKHRPFYVLSGHKSVTIPLTDDPVAFLAAVDSTGADYLVYDRLDGLADYYVRPVVLRRPQAFCVLRAEPRGTVLFGIRGSGRAAVEARSADQTEIGFEYCGVEHWKSAGARQRYGGRSR